MWVGAILTFAGVFAFRWLSMSDFDNDHFDHVARAFQVLAGDWPVRDFIDPGLPLMYLLSAAVHALVDKPFLAEALIFVSALALAAALSFRLAFIASGSLLLASAAVVLQAALYPRSYSYPKLLVYALALTVGWWTIERFGPKRLTALAAVTGFAYYFRHDHGLYVAIGAVTLLVVHLRTRGFPTVARTVGLYLGLTTVVVLPHLVYVQWHAGIPGYLAMLGDFGRVEARRESWLRPPGFTLDSEKRLWGRHDPARFNIRWISDVDDEVRVRLEGRYGLHPIERAEGSTWRYEITDLSRDNVRALRRDPAVEDTHDFERVEAASRWRTWLVGWLLPGAGLLPSENAAPLLFWLFWVAPLAGTILIASRIRAGSIHLHEDARIAMLIALAFCVNVGFLRNPLEGRLPDAAMPHTVLWPWLLALLWRLPGRPVPLIFRRSALVGAATLVVLAIHFVSEPAERLDSTRVLGGLEPAIARWQQVTAELQQDLGGPLPNGPARALLPFLEYVRQCTAPDDRLVYVGYAPEIYVFARRAFGGGQLVFLDRYHSSPAAQALTVERLGRQHVPLLLLPRPLRTEFQDVFGDVWHHFEGRYEPMTSIPMDDGTEVDILIDGSRMVTSRYGPAKWPCLVHDPMV
jgi:hypothetical protein